MLALFLVLLSADLAIFFLADLTTGIQLGIYGASLLLFLFFLQFFRNPKRKFELKREADPRPLRWESCSY